MPLTADDLTDAWFLEASGFLAEHHIVEPMAEAHWHDHLEINLICKGEMTYLFNGRRITLQEGGVYCFWAAVPHQVIEAEAATELVCVYVPFADFLSLAIPDGFKADLMTSHMLTGTTTDHADAELFRRWATDWPSCEENYEEILRDEVRLRIKRIARNARHAEVVEEGETIEELAPTRRLLADRRVIDLVQKMTRYINTEFGNPIGVEEVSQVVGLHPSNATANFQKVLGLSIAQYIRRRRLNQAMKLLVDTDKAIIEIAFNCGYGSLSRFYDAFQKQVRCTPRAYRLRFRQQEQRAAV